jgi:hypothetical protein
MSPTRTVHKFIDLEYRECLESLRKGVEILFQIEIALALADLTLIGFGLTTGRAGVFFPGFALPFMMYKTLATSHTTLYPIVKRVSQIEAKYFFDREGFISILANQFREDERLYGFERRLATIPGGRSTRMVFFGAAMLHIVAPLVLFYVFHWNLF